MDIALTSAIVNTASAMTNRETSDAVQVAVLKKAMHVEAATVSTLLDAVQPPASPALANNGALGTRLNTYA